MKFAEVTQDVVIARPQSVRYNIYQPVLFTALAFQHWYLPQPATLAYFEVQQTNPHCVASTTEHHGVLYSTTCTTFATATTRAVIKGCNP